jgi:DNA-binding response OmpR family regulator
MPNDAINATVLLIDDEETILKMAGQRLRHAGYRVLTASSGAKGLALAKAEHPDAILLDVMMPAMSGSAVLQNLKGDPQTKDIPVIMLTAVGTDVDITQTIAAGATCYLHKPYQAKELLDEVAMAVDRHRTAHGITEPEASQSPAKNDPDSDTANPSQ